MPVARKPEVNNLRIQLVPQRERGVVFKYYQLVWEDKKGATCKAWLSADSARILIAGGALPHGS